jgi:hypothetical protein
MGRLRRPETGEPPERIRWVGIVSGLLTATTALLWGGADLKGWLPEPRRGSPPGIGE